MTPTDIRALSAAMIKAIEQARAEVARASAGCTDADVLKELDGLHGFLGDAIGDHITGGLDHIADHRDEDDKANEFYDRADYEYEKWRDEQMEKV